MKQTHKVFLRMILSAWICYLSTAAAGPVWSENNDTSGAKDESQAASAPDSGEQSQHANGIWARVNDESLTVSDVQKALTVQIEELKKVWKQPELNKRVLNEVHHFTTNWIESRLALAEATERGLSITTKEVEDTFAKEVAGKAAGDLAKYEDILVRNGSSIAEHKKQIREGLLINRLKDMVTVNKVFVKPREVREFYEKHHDEFQEPPRVTARRIVMVEKKEMYPTEEECRKALDAKMDPVAKAVLDGADFAETAHQNSQFPKEAAQGGMVGVVRRGETIPEMEEALFAMEVGEIRRVYVTRENEILVVLLRLEEKLDASTADFETVREAIYNRIFQQKYKDVVDQFMLESRQRYYVYESQ